MRLRLIGPNGERREFDSDGKVRLDIGRTEDNDVTISSITVSRYHCRLTTRAGGRAVLEDVGSRYGTRVNNVPISGPTVLNSDDQFVIGSWTGQILEEPVKEQGQNSDGGLPLEARRPLSLEADLAPTVELASSPTNPSVWTPTHRILLGALGLIAVALLVYIAISNS